MSEPLWVPPGLRPPVPKVSSPPNIEHHKFEDYLASPYMEKFLGLLTRRNGNGVAKVATKKKTAKKK